MTRAAVLFVLAAASMFGSAHARPAAQATFPACELFSTMPSWTESYNAVWNTNPGQVVFSIPATGGATDGNTSYLSGYRTEHGSSVRMMRYPVPVGTNIYVGFWMRCPSFDPSGGAPPNGRNYWAEAGYLMGSGTAVGYDTGAGTGGGPEAWTLLMKFDYDPLTSHPNGNGDSWTWYSAGPLATGTNSEVSIGFKIGSNYGGAFEPVMAGPDMGWDGFCLSNAPLPTPPPSPSPLPGGGSPPPPGGGAPGGSGVTYPNREHPNGDEGINDGCSCGSVAWVGGQPWMLVAAALSLLFLRR